MPAPKSAIARNARGITRYLQLYHHLSYELTEGRFPAGAALPSEPELARRHHISRTTVRRALDRLEREGRIERRRGSGTFAWELRTEPLLVLALQKLCDLRPRLHQSGPTPRKRTLRRLRFHHGRPFRLESIDFRGGNGHTARIERVTHHISAVTADAIAAQRLGVIPGTPLLRIRTEFHGRHHRLMAVTDSVIRCDRANVRAQVKREGRSNGWTLAH